MFLARWTSKRAVTASMCAVILGLSTAALAHENHAPLPTKGVTIAGENVLLSDKAREAIGLTTAEVTLGDVHRTVEVEARVELPWNQQAMITSLVPGKIDRVLVRPGETVAAGQELAQVASVELESLQLAMLQAASELKLAEQVLQQRQTLDAEGVIAGKNLIEAEATAALKTAELRVAEEKLRALGISDAMIERIRTQGESIRDVPITAPIAGVVTHADVRIGQVVQPTDHLYHVVDPSRLWIVGEVLESDVRHLEKGQQVEARFAAFPDRTFDGVIDHVRLKMDRRRRTQSVVIAVENPDGRLRPGMFGRVSIAVRVAEDAIVCPADAVITNRTGTYLLVERIAGKYENRAVELGLEKGEQVEVLKGVFPGNRVVVTGAYLLASLLGNEHKARVKGDAKEKETVSETNDDLLTVADAAVELPTDQQSFAGSRIAGRVRIVLVEPSQRVEVGQVLAVVDSIELRTVQLDLMQTAARLRLVEKSLARLAPTQELNITPQRRLWELQNERETLRQGLASLKRRLAFFGLTEEQIDKLESTDFTKPNAAPPLVAGVPVRAPAPGWIVGFHIVPGQVVSPDDQLFEIHDLSKVWVKGYVFERDAARIMPGQRAKVTFSAFPNLEALGTVVRIAPMMEEGERVLPIWVEVDNPEQRLKEGMLARIAIRPENGSNAAPQTAQLRPIESPN